MSSVTSYSSWTLHETVSWTTWTSCSRQIHSSLLMKWHSAVYDHLSTSSFQSNEWSSAGRNIYVGRVCKLLDTTMDPQNHRLRSSASPVLTATHYSYGSVAWLSDFFPAHPWRSDPPTDFHAKWLKRRGFTQGCAFCCKNRNFSYPLISRAAKRSKFCKFFTRFYL